MYDFTKVCVTAKALNQRFNQKAVDFLKGIFYSILQKQFGEPLSIIENLSFHRIRILDSTGFKTLTDDLDTGYQGCTQDFMKDLKPGNLEPHDIYH